jgi:hypothetical protein
MDDPIEPHSREELKNPLAVTDVDLVMREMSGGGLQPLQVPAGAPLRTEEFLPHVVVDTDDIGPDRVVISNGGGTYQPT